MKIKLLILSLTVLCLSAAPAMADLVSFGDGGTSLQGVLDSITVSPIAGTSSVNVVTDSMYDSEDSGWSITGASGSLSTVIIELAGLSNQNTMGIWDTSNPSNTLQLFGGAATTGSQVLLSILTDGSVIVNFSDTGVNFGGNSFGWYIDSSANVGGGFFYSDTALNSDGLDHMLAFQGQNTDTIQIANFASGLWTSSEYILAFEDSLNIPLGSSDTNYSDFVFIVESVVPVPAAVLLGLVGLGVAGLKLRKYA